MRRTLVGLLVVSVCLLAACDSNSSAKDSGGAASSTTGTPTSSTAGGTTTTAAGGAALEGPTWRLVSVTGDPPRVPTTVAITATFADGTVSGSSGCNSYRAPYTVDGSQLAIGATAGTKMACAPSVMAQETGYLTALRQVRSYKVTAGSLELTSSNQRGRRVLAFEEERQDLIGSWNVNGYLTATASAFTSVLAGTRVTARFDSTGRVTGSSGCNSYGGKYTTTGSAISITELGSTLMLCTKPDGVERQEQDFQAALMSAKSFSVAGDTLTLFDGQKRRAVTMTRAPTS